MSHYWYLHCEQCNETSGSRFNRQSQSLALVQAWSLIKPLRDAIAKNVHLEIVEIGIRGDYEEPFVLDFMDTHFEHGVSLQSEYGEIKPIPLEVNDGT